MRWATRAAIHIDRAACAWLIRRHIDGQADFIFVADPAEIPADATTFDIPGAELSHHAGDCSFETILRRYDLADPVLWRIAAIAVTSLGLLWRKIPGTSLRRPRRHRRDPAAPTASQPPSATIRRKITQARTV